MTCVPQYSLDEGFGTLDGFRPRLCRAQRPQTKGKTENGVGYVRKNFWPRVRDYREAHDLLDLRRRWLDETCNVRIHGTFEKDGIWVYYRLAANLAPATRKLLAELVA